MALDELAITMGKLGAGEWTLRLDDGETVAATLDEVEVSEERGFHAEGRDEERALLYELTTGTQNTCQLTFPPETNSARERPWRSNRRTAIVSSGRSASS